ncbi:hypothetical protein [Rhizobium rhizogenes]|uniref:hypothetical protein n=1 Tax=Rhizobium rhizogenes TaxID=359 RepID=UPI0004D86EA3|nr:hypothetical protein [Rhizobium rhizogenes]KEA07134.1 hypothetical protein CN09_09295 [Rhizobium rhizogenes]NTI80435.1 hypothetical protein [Rhizobium rhizogenes]NTJ22621.1 hypothetical protein [Rhizobium rhizogenes]QUE81325.1 hypothetical protein EML492_05830 [Rhizobium rhizogenes]TQO80577.1 hypothetical protein FFE80_05605 [Rhizobium rhizogenes]
MAAMCPKCELDVHHFNYENKDARDAFSLQPTYPAVALTCVNCSTILGAAIDPIFLQSQILNALKKK